MTSIVYLLYSHDHRLLPTQVEHARRYLAPERIVVVQGPIGDHPRRSAGAAWVNDAIAEALGVETLAVTSAVLGQATVIRQAAAYDAILDAIQRQHEACAWILEGDCLPMLPMTPEQVLCGRPVAGRFSGTHTWLCATSIDLSRELATVWPAWACTREHWPDALRMPTDYTDTTHWEWCEPGFLHLDRISVGLGNKINMLSESLGRPLLPGPLADVVPHVYPKGIIHKNKWPSSVPVGVLLHDSIVDRGRNSVPTGDGLAGEVERGPGKQDGGSSQQAQADNSQSQELHGTPPIHTTIQRTLVDGNPPDHPAYPRPKQTPPKQDSKATMSPYTPISGVSDAELERRKAICLTCKHLGHVKDSPIVYCKRKCPKRKGKRCESKGIAKYRKALLEPEPWCAPWTIRPPQAIIGATEGAT